ncbi:MAG TPA: DUF4339 domain-containing protein, partial [Polyangiaceae bacterium]|nr:DUF4339 domain-containing protein [Polyangiaceae bacterium]
MSNEKRWFVSVGGGAPVGPVTRDQLIRGTQAGKIPIDAIVCEEGGTTWTPLRELPDIRSHAAARDVEAAGSDDGRAWFVRAPGTAETGPVTTDKLLKSIRSGGIPRESEVRE